jgi:hypothetical protein
MVTTCEALSLRLACNRIQCQDTLTDALSGIIDIRGSSRQCQVAAWKDGHKRSCKVLESSPEDALAREARYTLAEDWQIEEQLKDHHRHHHPHIDPHFQRAIKTLLLVRQRKGDSTSILALESEIKAAVAHLERSQPEIVAILCLSLGLATY